MAVFFCFEIRVQRNSYEFYYKKKCAVIWMEFKNHKFIFEKKQGIHRFHTRPWLFLTIEQKANWKQVFTAQPVKITNEKCVLGQS